MGNCRNVTNTFSEERRHYSNTYLEICEVYDEAVEVSVFSAVATKGQVNKGKNQGEEEDSKDLLSNGLLDLEVVQANLLKNNKALTILITFGNLFIVNHKNCAKHEDDG